MGGGTVQYMAFFPVAVVTAAGVRHYGLGLGTGQIDAEARSSGA
jgi:hypothetical protein